MKRLLFGKKMCSACQELKEKFNKENIEYEYYDLDTVDGLAIAAMYDVVILPKVIILDDNNNIIEG